MRKPARLADLSFCCSPSPMSTQTWKSSFLILRRKGKAAARRQALAQVPGGPVDERDAPHHVSFEWATRLPEKRDHFVDGQMAEPGKCRIDPGRRMAMAHHDPVPRLPVERRVGEEHKVHIEGRHRAARVAGTCKMRHRNDVSLGEPGQLLEPRQFLCQTSLSNNFSPPIITLSRGHRHGETGTR